jgi:mRNA-degrading endonuclease toxin of MazEF toxin-antitoxin module
MFSDRGAVYPLSLEAWAGGEVISKRPSFIRRLDQAADLLTELIIKSGAKPKALTKR